MVMNQTMRSIDCSLGIRAIRQKPILAADEIHIVSSACPEQFGPIEPRRLNGDVPAAFAKKGSFKRSYLTPIVHILRGFRNNRALETFGNAIFQFIKQPELQLHVRIEK